MCVVCAVGGVLCVDARFVVLAFCGVVVCGCGVWCCCRCSERVACVVRC